MCYLSTSFDKENGTSKAGSHKRRKKTLKGSWQKRHRAIFANSSSKYLPTTLSVLKSCKKWYKKFIMQR